MTFACKFKTFFLVDVILLSQFKVTIICKFTTKKFRLWLLRSINGQLYSRNLLITILSHKFTRFKDEIKIFVFVRKVALKLHRIKEVRKCLSTYHVLPYFENPTSTSQFKHNFELLIYQQEMYRALLMKFWSWGITLGVYLHVIPCFNVNVFKL